MIEFHSNIYLLRYSIPFSVKVKEFRFDDCSKRDCKKSIVKFFVVFVFSICKFKGKSCRTSKLLAGFVVGKRLENSLQILKTFGHIAVFVKL